MPLPGPTVVMAREKEQRQHHFVYFVFVVLHMGKILFSCTTRKTLPHRTLNHAMQLTPSRTAFTFHENQIILIPIQPRRRKA
jgi:hypothetical protein